MEIRNVIELSASEREDLPKKIGLSSCNNNEVKEELYTCVLLKCGFSIRVIESVGEVYSKIIQRTYNSTI